MPQGRVVGSRVRRAMPLLWDVMATIGICFERHDRHPRQRPKRPRPHPNPSQCSGDPCTRVASCDEQRGLDGLSAAEVFCRTYEGTGGGLVRTMLAPDRIETCTETLLRRTAAAADALDVPVRLHCCQSRLEYEMVVARTGHSPPEWLAQVGLLSPRALLPHGTWVSGSRGVGRPGQDLALLREGGATVVHCPIVSARGGRALDSFGSLRIPTIAAIDSDRNQPPVPIEASRAF